MDVIFHLIPGFFRGRPKVPRLVTHIIHPVNFNVQQTWKKKLQKKGGRISPDLQNYCVERAKKYLEDKKKIEEENEKEKKRLEKEKEEEKKKLKKKGEEEKKLLEKKYLAEMEKKEEQVKKMETGITYITVYLPSGVFNKITVSILKISQTCWYLPLLLDQKVLKT